MSKKTEIILAVGIAAALMIVSLAVADHIKNAQIVEFQTPYCKIMSSY